MRKRKTWFGSVLFGQGRRVYISDDTQTTSENSEDSEDVIELEDDVEDVACTHLHVAILLKNGKIFTRNLDDVGGKLELRRTSDADDVKKLLVGTFRKMYVVVVNENKSEVVEILDDTGIPAEPPVKFPWPVKIVEAASGYDFLIFRDTTGNVFSMGTGTRGELGVGLIRYVAEPVHVEDLAGIRIRKIVCGGWHTVALTDGGDAYTWGWNRYGQLGKEKGSSEEYPVLVDLMEEFSCSSENIEDVEATENTSRFFIKGNEEQDTELVLGSDSAPLINEFSQLID